MKKWSIRAETWLTSDWSLLYAAGRLVRALEVGEAGGPAAQAELVALGPDVILATTTAATVALQQATRTLPIVFTMVVDPVGADIVESLPRPGGNTTGFMQFEYSLSGKWLELLKQIAPGVTRAAILRDPSIPTGIGQFAVIQALAPPSALR